MACSMYSVHYKLFAKSASQNLLQTAFTLIRLEMVGGFLFHLSNTTTASKLVYPLHYRSICLLASP